MSKYTMSRLRICTATQSGPSRCWCIIRRLSQVLPTITQAVSGTITGGQIPGFDVHHTLQQGGGEKILKDRYLKEKNIDIDDPKYLRGVRKADVHNEITEVQNRWRIKQMQARGLNPSKAADVQNFWKTVPLSDLDKLNADIEDTYSKFWLKPNASSANINKLKKLNSQQFALGKGSRIAKVLPWLVVGLGIFTLIGDNLAFAENIANNSPEQAGTWKLLQSLYSQALNDALNGRNISHGRAIHLANTFISYFRLMGADGSTLDRLQISMNAWIDLNIP